MKSRGQQESKYRLCFHPSVPPSVSSPPFPPLRFLPPPFPSSPSLFASFTFLLFSCGCGCIYRRPTSEPPFTATDPTTHHPFRRPMHLTILCASFLLQTCPCAQSISLFPQRIRQSAEVTLPELAIKLPQGFSGGGEEHPIPCHHPVREACFFPVGEVSVLVSYCG